MEVGRHIYWRIARCIGFIILFSLMEASPVQAQPAAKKYIISKGGMQINLGKGLPDAALNDFIKQYDLSELALPQLLKNNFKDSIIRHGWKIELNNSEMVVLTKPFAAAEGVNDPALMIRMTGMGIYFSDVNTVSMVNQIGYNSFRSQQPFAVKDSVVTFVLRKNLSAQRVRLAGSFTNWESGALPMIKTDSGWSLQVRLRPGKHLYKFITDGNWITDPDNINVENDGEGNTNSVYFFTNTAFRLNGYANARKVYVAGSFSNWQEDRLRMTKTGTGWELPVYLDTGTYTYRFIINNNNWIIDPANPDRFPNEFGDSNSVIRVGKPILFELLGLPDAKKVFLAGSFNGFHNYELAMKKTATGWTVPYVLGSGNYEYKFFVDGQWVDARGNAIKKDEPGNIFVIEPNYTFRLKGQGNARTVFVSGDFNSWSPNAYKLTKQGDDWVLKLHLSPGKHVYKYVIDGNWTRDPNNELWEQNEYGTGNSVLWVE
jgi:hypothetical protein